MQFVDTEKSLLSDRLLKPYLLLRNNKKSGPHSIDELRLMALQSQDLVWVEGRSTSWRNPEEISELKTLLVGCLQALNGAVSPGSRKSSDIRVLCNVQLPDHRHTADYDPWPPTLSYHLNRPGNETFWEDAGSDMPFPNTIRIDCPLSIGLSGDTEGAKVTVKLVKESGYTGRGRRSVQKEAYRVTPVFERSSEARPDQRARGDGSGTRRISIEFLSD
jgi:hypothetical protein